MWTLTSIGKYVTEVSTLTHYLAAGSFLCPNCEHRLWFPNGFRTVIDNGELIKWETTCQSCEKILTVFND